MPVDRQPPTDAPTGAVWVACVDAPLDAGTAAAWVTVPACGAVVTFAGTVRDHAGDRTGVTALEYEAYEGHVERVLAEVADELRVRHPDLGRAAIWHRVGTLAVTDVAVVVAVSTGHRDGAFAAARWAIDEVKARAPIWKREHHAGGVDWGRCDHDPALPSAPVEAVR